MATCAKAIQQWEEANPEKNIAEEQLVKFICQNPPIEKMDASLNRLASCKQLSLSSNQIEKMINLPDLKKMEILSLARNYIKKITGLEELGENLQQLWISYNSIEKLDGLTPHCTALEVLYISNNKIKSWEEVEKLVINMNLSNNEYNKLIKSTDHHTDSCILS
eukprot:GHVL01031000.1.p1 GENE.GHVL01031000.1~~GHVL01031000.1.p1  ORF type:complete len:164 (+),score=23.23 GHVL01031000.1:43-534(+)